MTQEEKQLLIKDFCARLPYGVKVSYTSLLDNMPKIWDVVGFPVAGCVDIMVTGKYRFSCVPIEEIKPYLRPMSSMTDEEKKEYRIECNRVLSMPFKINGPYPIDDWLNAHHFDYRGLIEKGLALEAPEGMYKIE